MCRISRRHSDGRHNFAPDALLQENSKVLILGRDQAADTENMTISGDLQTSGIGSDRGQS